MDIIFWLECLVAFSWVYLRIGMMHIICVTPFGCSLILNFMILIPDTKLYDQFPEGYANLFIVTDVARVTVTDVVCVTSWLLPIAKTL